jgi:tRNA threonylcarbamoyl adenosine modification protein YeaZ
LILVIDTSSALSALALLDRSRQVVREAIHPSGRSFDLPARFRYLAEGEALTKVAVATGPGSFTGLRVGVSFGLGLAIGLRIPIVPLPTLGIQAARSDQASIAVSEAGRGRVYYLVPGGKPALGEPNEIPKTHWVVGFVSPAVESGLRDAGLRFRPEAELRSFGEATALLLEMANEVAYGSLRLEYMQSFSAPRT